MVYGVWVLICDSELAREKMWSRIHLIPLLTAEEDRDLVRRHLADQAREKALLGTNTSPYNSDRYVSLLFELGIGGKRERGFG
jgi:NADH dehydrogenase (ubiquinone) 1 alpha subcomplex subunit 13